jgi:tetratricopeptide (TPR) repeat protein
VTEPPEPCIVCAMTRARRSRARRRTPEPPGALAARAVALASTDPQQARTLGLAARRHARVDGDPVGLSTAELALGSALRELNDLPAAVRHLRQAVRVAERHDLGLHAARARHALAGALAARGDLEAALRENRQAEPALRGDELGRLYAQRMTIHYIQGRLDDALELSRRALPILRRAGDRLHEAKVLNNRAMVLSYRGALAAAEADLRRAGQLYGALGMRRLEADTRQNLGFVAAFRGDLPAALAWFDRADAWFRANGIVDAVGLRDRCEALLPAGLVVEARRAAEEAVRHLEAEGRGSFLAEARLLLSEAALRDGDPVTARVEADRALRTFARQRRSRWVAAARYAALRAAWLGGERSQALLAAARRTAAGLAAAGWVVPALDAHLIAAQLALERGRLEQARNELASAARARRRGPVDLRSRAWHAQALVRLASGDRRGAESALRAGMRVLDAFRGGLGATELRAHVSAHAGDVARLGLRLAVEERRADRVLAWAERWRAGALQLRPVRPPGDTALQDALAELRRVVSQLEQGALAGRDTTGLRRRQATLEQTVQRRARHVAGDAYGLASRPSVAELGALLGDAALVEVVALDGRLHAVVLAGGRLSLHRLGDLQEVSRELAGLRFGLRRLAFAHGSPPSLEAAATAVAYAAGRLDELLIGPLLARLGGERPLVLVPTGVLHALPWSALPSLHGRPLSVAPSAALWRRAAAAAAEAGAGGGRVVVVEGPGLPGAAGEVAALAGRYPDATCMTGPAATVAAVAQALDGAELAHVAAHGAFRVDNPLFSSLQLADGPLTVYDLEGLARAPRRLVLSACDSGLSGVRPGDELMGLAGALFALGMSTLVASVIPVPDAATKELMLALHQGLQTGLGPAAALAGAQAASGLDAVSASFVCFGAGLGATA